jgi:hypothetical protein
MSTTVKLYLHCHICFHGVVLNELSTGATSPCIGISQGIIALTHVICTARKFAVTLKMEVTCSSKSRRNNIEAMPLRESAVGTSNDTQFAVSTGLSFLVYLPQ